MFIIVNYGDKKKALFNPNCKTRLLLENIKDRCQIPRELEIDLSDNTGHLKHLSQSTCQYANEILTTERESLVPIEIRRNNPAQFDEVDGQTKQLLAVPSPLNEPDITYIPLLNDQDIVTVKFQAQLSRKGTPTAAEGKTRRRKPKRNSEALNTSLEKANFDQLAAQAGLPKRNGSGKGARRGSQSINRSKSRGKNK